MTRAALVASVLAVAAGTPLSAVAGRQGQTPPRSTFVVRGVVVQYIPPSGSVVGSMSVRVVSTGKRGRALLGELVTVTVVAGKGLSAGEPPLPRSLWTITLRAPSPQSVLKGTAAVQKIVAGAPGKGSGSGTPPANGSSRDSGSPNNSDSGGATSPTNDPGNSGSDPQPSSGNASGSSGHGSDGNGSNGNGSNGNGNAPSDHASGQSSDGGSGSAAHGSGQSSGSGAGNANGHK